MSRRKTRVSADTTGQAGEFLFGSKGMSESQFMDMRTRIRSPKMLELLLYYSVMGISMNSETALEIKDSTQRLLISQETRNSKSGRGEAVDVLRQNFPKRVEVEKGWDEDSEPYR